MEGPLQARHGRWRERAGPRRIRRRRRQRRRRGRRRRCLVCMAGPMVRPEPRRLAGVCRCREQAGPEHRRCSVRRTVAGESGNALLAPDSHRRGQNRRRPCFAQLASCKTLAATDEFNRTSRSQPRLDRARAPSRGETCGDEERAADGSGRRRSRRENEREDRVHARLRARPAPAPADGLPPADP